MAWGTDSHGGLELIPSNGEPIPIVHIIAFLKAE